MNERDLFMVALQIEDAAERAAYLDRACASEAALRQRVEALLAAFEQAGSFLQQPAADPQATSDLSHRGPSSDSDPAEEAGTAIGPYKLLEQIGEGGMGTVWMAQQTEPVKRLVAVKLIKAGMDSRQVIARFEAERQALALMDHPHIARVLDARATGAGRPYFVMELVKGVPITRYCDEHRLTSRQRLELFVPVCQAVQHAHHKGIIHRDIKPSNVPVALYDGKPVPKVIDFGVAKAAGQSLTEKTLVTGFGAIVGTLEYMSPEQAEVNQLDIDTRSDIYALGVLLYELLTGSPPFTRRELEGGGVLEMLRVIREQEPTKPSTKLSTAEGLPALAANRGTEPAKLTKLVRGELDWIVMKALEKDRNRRYQTANDFSLDVQRYLADEPVEASPPSAAYRLRKFVRRNRVAVLAAGVFAGLLVAATAVSAGLGWWANTERLRAVTAEASAEGRLRQVQKANEVLAAFFQDLDPEQAQKEGKDLRVALGERLDVAAAQLEGESVGDPLVVAELQHALAKSQLHLGYADRAVTLFQQAAATRESKLGPDHLTTLASHHALAAAYLAVGRTAEAIKMQEATLKLMESQLGPDNPDTLNSRNNLALAYRAAGRTAEAIQMHKATLKLRESKLGPDHPKTFRDRNNLAEFYRAAGRTAEAIQIMRGSRLRESG
jgi:serine/threonine protein kinase